MNCILIPGYNRPEFFKLVVDSLMRNHELMDYNMLFVLEKDVKAEYHTIISTINHGLNSEVMQWPEHYGLTKSIMEGMKLAISKSDEYIVVVEDDVIVSADFLHFLDYCYRHYCMTNENIVTVGTTTNRQLGGVDRVYKEQWYLPWGVLITKSFFDGYMLEHCNSSYYINSKQYANEYYFMESKGNEVEQAGLILRVMVKNGFYQVLPEVPRSLEIGFYGKHRRANVFHYEDKSLQEKIEFTKQQVIGGVI